MEDINTESELKKREEMPINLSDNSQQLKLLIIISLYST